MANVSLSCVVLLNVSVSSTIGRVSPTIERNIFKDVTINKEIVISLRIIVSWKICTVVLLHTYCICYKPRLPKGNVKNNNGTTCLANKNVLDSSLETFDLASKVNRQNVRNYVLLSGIWMLQNANRSIFYFIVWIGHIKGSNYNILEIPSDHNLTIIRLIFF